MTQMIKKKSVLLITTAALMAFSLVGCKMPNKKAEEPRETVSIANFNNLMITGPVEVTLLQGTDLSASKTAGVKVEQASETITLSGQGKIALTSPFIVAFGGNLTKGARLDLAGQVPESLILSLENSTVISSLNTDTKISNINLRAKKSTIAFYRASFSNLNLFALEENSTLTVKFDDSAAINYNSKVDGTSLLNYYGSSTTVNEIKSILATYADRIKYHGEGTPAKPK